MAIDVFAESSRDPQSIEEEGSALARELCAEDLGCKRIFEQYDKESDAKGRSILFAALVLYVDQTLGPKLSESDKTKKKLQRIRELFEEHMALE